MVRPPSVYRNAASGGLAEAQYNLGVLYEKGLGVSRDLDRAMRRYLLAAEGGLAEAEFNPGALSPPGDSTTVTWFRLAADQDLAAAQSALGFRYWKGDGVPEDKVIAYFWPILAATRPSSGVEQSRKRLAE
jgi:TPR repeat protein